MRFLKNRSLYFLGLFFFSIVTQSRDVLITSSLRARAGASQESQALGLVPAGTRGVVVDGFKPIPFNEGNLRGEYVLVEIRELPSSLSVSQRAKMEGKRVWLFNSSTQSRIEFLPQAQQLASAPKARELRGVLAKVDQVGIFEASSGGGTWSETGLSIQPGDFYLIDERFMDSVSAHLPEMIPIQYLDPQTGKPKVGYIRRDDVVIKSHAQVIKEQKLLEKSQLQNREPVLEERISYNDFLEMRSGDHQKPASDYRSYVDSKIQNQAYRPISAYNPLKGSYGRRCHDYNEDICGLIKTDFKHNPLAQDLDFFFLVKSVIYQESRYDPMALRVENHDLRKKQKWAGDVLNKYVAEQGISRSEFESNRYEVMKFEASYGLMQILFPTAYGSFQYREPAEELLDPQNNIRMGMKLLLQKLQDAQRKKAQGYSFGLHQMAAAAYNGGSVRKSQSTGKLICHDNYDEKIVGHMEGFRSACGFSSLEDVCR